MTKGQSPTRKRYRVFFASLSSIAAIVTAIGTLYQISKPPEIRVFSDSKLQEQNKILVSEKNKFGLEKQALEKKIAELERKIDATKPKPEATTKSTFETDHWIVTALKTWAVYVALCLSAALTIFTFLIDLIGLFFGYSFDLTRALWGFSWGRVTINWYWDHAQWYGVVAGIASMGIWGVIMDYGGVPHRRRSSSGDYEVSKKLPNK